MTEQIYIGNFAKGLTNNRLPFNIDNDAFPFLYNFYTWRGRVRRKRGTALLGQLQIQVEAVATPTEPWEIQSGSLVVGDTNLITFFSLVSTSTIVPGSISFITTDDGQVYTEPSPPNGTLVGDMGGSGTINYATGAVNIIAGGNSPFTVSFSYYPGNPVMGLQDFDDESVVDLYPFLLAFDTKKSYMINQTTQTFYNVNYYKGTNIPFDWSGFDYQQFWTTNYSGALWATNGKVGFNFVDGTYTSGSGTANITFHFESNSADFTTLIVGDKLWFNEWDTGGSNINGLSGEVSDVMGAATGDYVVTFDTSVTVAGAGIAQLLTNTIPGQDGIKWYDGDPTAGTGIPTGTGLGWVNFSPPLTALAISIDNSPVDKYYLVGAVGIVPFKGRLIFFGPTIQSSTGAPIYLRDTALWSWDGTPYYTSPTPVNQLADQKAYYVDQTGLGGYLPAGIPQPIVTFASNEDVILVGFGGDGRKTRFISTSNDLQPFLFFNINSELPSSSTFSAIELDRGVLDIGQYGLALTDQQSCQRVDLEIPNEIFQIQAQNNGAQRVNAVRDFFREWIYFTYPYSTSQWKFPTQSLLFNYRDNTWAIQYENFTSQGLYRKRTKYSWKNIPFKPTWKEWREAWNSAATSVQFPSVVGGNPQGYVLIKGEGTGEGSSGTIKAITSTPNGLTRITSTNHCVTSANTYTNTGDYLYIQGCLGTTSINQQVVKVIATPDADTFDVDFIFPSGTYLGLGTYARLSQPLLKTKQFAPYWEQGRKTRLCVQKYLLDRTPNGQVIVNIYLSQDPNSAWNSTSLNTPPNSLIYSQIMYTCPESTNIGLTPMNTNLQMPTAATQFQIWHRFNTSLIGDSVQIGITLSDEQMRDFTLATSEISLHGIHLVVERSQQLA